LGKFGLRISGKAIVLWGNQGCDLTASDDQPRANGANVAQGQGWWQGRHCIASISGVPL